MVEKTEELEQLKLQMQRQDYRTTDRKRLEGHQSSKWIGGVQHVTGRVEQTMMKGQVPQPMEGHLLNRVEGRRDPVWEERRQNLFPSPKLAVDHMKALERSGDTIKKVYSSSA